MDLPLAAEIPTGRLRRVCGDEPGFFCRQVLEQTENDDFAEIADFVLGKPLTILAILIGAALISRLLRRLIKRTLRGLHAGAVSDRVGSLVKRSPAGGALMDTEVTTIRAEQRIAALTSVLRSIVSFVVWVIAAFMCLGEAGIELGPLLAGAGILGVALGFGSQSLVKDFLSGFFILVEDQYGVGDIVDLDNQTIGTVEAVSLRTTRLRSLNGTVWHVPNGDIRRAGNQSQLWSRAVLDLEVAYGTDVEHAKAVITRVSAAIYEERSDILEQPEVWGVEALGPYAVAIRLVVKTKPSEQWAVSRHVREAIKAEFEEEGIEIPFPQSVQWNRDFPPDGGAPGTA